MQIRIFPNPDALAIGAAEYIHTLAEACIADHGHFSLVLSGGSTPMHTYRQLVNQNHKQDLDWTKVQIFWGDERCVPPDHAQSNYRMAREAFFEHVPIPSENIHRMACEDDPAAGAEAYEGMLREQFPTGELPQFDLVLLGLGDDGHTASLFPGTEILEEQERWVAPIFVRHLESWRISLTFPVLNASTQTAFLVSGESKARIIQEILGTSAMDPLHPAQRIRPLQKLIWFLDHAAGSLLDPVD